MTAPLRERPSILNIIHADPSIWSVAVRATLRSSTSAQACHCAMARPAHHRAVGASFPPSPDWNAPLKIQEPSVLRPGNERSPPQHSLLRARPVPNCSLLQDFVDRGKQHAAGALLPPRSDGRPARSSPDSCAPVRCPHPALAQLRGNAKHGWFHLFAPMPRQGSTILRIVRVEFQ